MQKNNQKSERVSLKGATGGFTLIEMVIVIAVVGILMGLAFQGIRGVQSSARDTKRVADLRSMSNFLELYYANCGHYPGTSDCSVRPVTVNYTADLAGSELGGAITTASSRGNVARLSDIPKPQAGSTGYGYASLGNNLTYVLFAEMEKIPQNVVTGSVEGIDCTPTATNKRYCITN